MARCLVHDVEPFAEREGLAQDTIGLVQYRFGYRTENAKEVISAVDIPAEIVERTVSAGLSLLARITSEGNVVATLAGPNGGATALAPIVNPIPMDALVAETLDSESLRLEETSIEELEIFLGRLHRSISLVRKAIARFDDSNR